MEVRFSESRSEKSDASGNPEGSFSQKRPPSPKKTAQRPSRIGAKDLDALAYGVDAIGSGGHDARWEEVRRLTLDLAARVALHDAPAAGSKDELIAYCLALRTALASGQGFMASEFGEIETERIHRKLTAAGAREVLEVVRRCVKREQWFTAYDALNAFLMSALSRAA